MAAVCRERLNGVGDCRCAGGEGQRGRAAFKRRDALFQHVLRGIRQPAVDVAGVRETEAVGGVLTVAENIRRGLINRNGAGVSRGIGLFLADMELQSFKSVI